MFDNINRDLLPIKLHFFFFNAGTGPIVQFLPTIARQLGFRNFLVGTIYTILPVSGLIAKPLFGALADKFKLHKTFFLIFQAILTISLFTINFIPNIDKEKVTLSCDPGTILEICSKDGFSQDVIHKVISDSPHTIAKCQLTCDSSPDIFNELCNSWHLEQFCNNSTGFSMSKTFDFTATFDMFKDMNVKDCIYIRVQNATFKDNTVIPSCSKLTKTTCSALCRDNQALNQLLIEAQEPSSSTQSSNYQYYLFLWAAITSWVGMAVVVSIADAICIGILGNEKRKEYGKQKMWSCIGVGIFGIGSGYLVDYFSQGLSYKDYSCIFYIMSIAMIFDFIVSSIIKKRNVDCVDIKLSILSELLAIGNQKSFMVFMFWCIGVGMCTGVVWNFLFLFIEDLAMVSQTVWLKTLQGLLMGVQCFLGELPFNFLSGMILNKIGHINVMSLVLVAFAIRFMAYSLVSNIWIFLLLEIMHGPTLGLCYPAMVSYGDKITPAGTKATVQGLLGAVFEGIGVSSGSLLSGWLMDAYGGVAMFRIFSVGALVWLSIFWILQLILRKSKAYPIHQGHNHLASYAYPDDAILITTNQELETY